MKIEIDNPATCNDRASDVIRLENPDEVKSAISGNTLVLFKGSLDENPGTIDDRTGQYFDPRGTLIDIRIPTAPAGAQARSLSPNPCQIPVQAFTYTDGKSRMGNCAEQKARIPVNFSVARSRSISRRSSGHPGRSALLRILRRVGRVFDCEG